MGMRGLHAPLTLGASITNVANAATWPAIANP